ncbi:MAG TPA: ferritin family protein, partial [Dissulfurispiraceae bacterium]|nr:ferritin family protein [Dissulfurispiraceae bacterium]
DFAAYIEKNGYDFYSQASKKFSDHKIVELLEYLAIEETKHETLFKKLAKSADTFNAEESYGGEFNAYMKEFCASHSLASRDTLRTILDNLKTFEDVLDMAISFEKDSVVFFLELKYMAAFDKIKWGHIPFINPHLLIHDSTPCCAEASCPQEYL